MSIRSVAALALVMVAASACSNSTDPRTRHTDDGPVSVAAAFYPIAEIVSRVGGDRVDVLNLTPPGRDAHDAEITAKQMEQLGEAAVTFYLGDNFQPNIQSALSSVRGEVVDLLASARTITAQGPHDIDPHVWLDPQNMVTMTRTVADTLSTTRPQWRDEFVVNADRYTRELDSLGQFLDSSLQRCESPVLVTAHRGFSYLANRAGLESRSLLDYSGEDSATTGQIEAFVDELHSRQVTTIFYEEAISKESMQTVADLAGARTVTLDPIETVSRAGIEAGETYVSLQRMNITRIAEGLHCS